MQTCLIVGGGVDPHAEALATELAKRDVRAVRFCSQLGEAPPRLEFRLGDRAPRLRLSTPDQQIEGGEVQSVFWRVKTPLWGPATANPEQMDHDFCFREWNRAIGGLYSALPHAHWINPFPQHWHAGYKLTQLDMAARLGLAIPDTVVSNDAEAIEPLYERGEVIYKPLSSPFHAPGRIIMTTKVSREEFEQDREHILAAPCLFQRYIPKAYELRVTIIGSSVIAMRIDSQKHAHTAVDWRADQFCSDLYSLHTLPTPVRAKLLELMKALGLVYGALDLIVTPEGEYVFLEVNPGGQWLWLEQLTGTPITAEIAGFIATGHSTCFGPH